MTDIVLYDSKNAVATITLNRPDVLNALSKQLLEDLLDSVEKASADDTIRAIVITGSGRGFCSGADLAAGMAESSGQPPGEVLRERYHPLIEAIRAAPKPVISAVNGVAAGAGMSIALAADIVLASRSATFLQAFSKIGLVPDAGSTWLLDRYAGSMRARAMALLAESIPAGQAQQMGLVWQVFDDDELSNQALSMAEHLATMPTRAYALIKQAFDVAPDNTLAQQLEVEADLQTMASQTADFREGVMAFMGKRKPNFTGK